MQFIHRSKVHLVGYNAVACNTVYIRLAGVPLQKSQRNHAKFPGNSDL